MILDETTLYMIKEAPLLSLGYSVAVILSFLGSLIGMYLAFSESEGENG